MRRQRQAHFQRQSARQRAVTLDDGYRGLPEPADVSRVQRQTADSVLAAFRPPAMDDCGREDDEPAEIMASASDQEAGK